MCVYERERESVYVCAKEGERERAIQIEKDFIDYSKTFEKICHKYLGKLDLL